MQVKQKTRTRLFTLYQSQGQSIINTMINIRKLNYNNKSCLNKKNSSLVALININPAMLENCATSLYLTATEVASIHQSASNLTRNASSSSSKRHFQRIYNHIKGNYCNYADINRQNHQYIKLKLHSEPLTLSSRC